MGFIIRALGRGSAAVGLVSEEDVGGSGLEGLHSVRPLGADEGELLFPGMKFLAMAHTDKVTLFVSVPDDLLLG